MALREKLAKLDYEQCLYEAKRDGTEEGKKEMREMLRLPEQIENIIQEFSDGVRDILGDRTKKIILYGSYARGDYNKKSDIDIMILTDLSDEEIFEYRDKIWEYAYDIEWNNNFDITLSPLIKNIDKFNYWLETLPFYMNVQKEGVEID